MTFLRTIVFNTAPPTLVSLVMARAVALHAVMESGNEKLATAWPLESVIRRGSQRVVSGNALRTLGITRRSGLMAANER